MASKNSGQKFIARNRAPRVQIEYDVEIYGSEIDIDNFDARMKAMKPRAAFIVPNTLTGEGNLAVDITFESMDDFSPAAVARKVDALSKLLQARTELHNLLSYMDGKTGAEDLIAKTLQDPALLKTLAAAPKSKSEPAGDDTAK